MPRVTRRSLASKKEEDAAQPAPSGGKRGSKKPEPVVEPEPIGEPAPSKTARRGKGAATKEEPPKGKTPSRGRGKKQEEPEEEIEESPAPKRGRGRGKKDDVEEKVEEVPATKRGARGGRGKKEEEPVQEEEVAPPVKRPARGGRGKKEEEPDDNDDEEEELPPPKRAARGGRGKKEEAAVEEEEDLPPPKRAARGGRGKKEEQKVEEASTPEKPSPKGRARSARGSKGSQPKEVNEEKEPEEEEAEEDVCKSTPEKTSTSGGRRGKGKKEDTTPTPTKQGSVVEEKPESDQKVEEESKDDEEKSEDKMEVESEDKAEGEQKEEMDVEPEAKSEQKIPSVQAHDEDMEAEEKVEVGKKRKLEEDSEEESSPKKARISETDASKDEDASAVSDYVVINKEDVPAADSKEVEAALPPQVEDEKQAPAEMETADTTTPPPNTDVDAAPPKMSAPSNVVPLTEAELAKQYNPTIRDRDENSSMMVEVGSEAASDVGSVSRNLDVSEMAAVEQAGQDDSIASSDVSELSTSSKPADSTTTTPSFSNKISVSAAAPESAPSVVEMTSIPLPAEKSSPVTQQQTETEKPSAVLPAATPVQSAPAPPSNSQTTAPPVQVNSIPMPPDSNNSSSDCPSAVPSQQLPPPPVPVAQPSQNATAQNGSCKPSEQVAQSTPLHTSTPAKKPITLDSSYVPSSPSITKRKFLSNHSFPIELMDPAFCFSVVSYNILADCHLRRYDYSYTEAQYLDLTYRHTLFMKELEYLDGDIVCMQEVDTKYYSDVLLPAMTSRGYQGMFKKRTQDWYDEGEATFVKTSKFEVLSYDGISLKDLAYEEITAAGLTGDVSRAAKKYVDRADVVLVCKLLSKRTGKHLTVGNIHVAFDPKSPDLQCIQVASAVKELVSKAGSDLNPYIICGDFNSETTTPAYQLAKDGYLTDEHIRVLQNIQSMDNTEGTSKSIIHYLWKAFQHTSSNMKSAYETTVGREPVITSMNGLVKACLDYIFYSSSTLYTVGAMEVIDPQVIEATGGLPSKDIPSDHLSVKAVFRLKD